MFGPCGEGRVQCQESGDLKFCANSQVVPIIDEKFLWHGFVYSEFNKE